MEWDILALNVSLLLLEKMVWRDTLKIKHKGVRFSCDQCKFVTTRVDYLKKYVKTKKLNTKEWNILEYAKLNQTLRRQIRK